MVSKPDRINNEDTALLEILTSQEFPEEISPKAKVEIAMIKTFHKNLINDTPNSYLNKLNELVQLTKIEVEKKHQVILNEVFCLRILSKFNWSKIAETFTNLKQHLNEIFSSCQIKSEGYHIERAPDLHFYMKKVTQKNINDWQNFIDDQINVNHEVHNWKYSGGLCAFGPSLSFYDWSKAEVWTAFIANKVLPNSNPIEKRSIEMFVTMITSENSSFISFSGISRCGTYKGEQHRNASAEFQSLIASTTQKHYQYTKDKLYMITCPVFTMGEILIKHFEKLGFQNHAYIGFEEGNNLLISAEGRSNTDLNSAQKIVERIREQNIKVANGEIIPPINVTMNESKLKSYCQYKEYGNKCLSFEVKDKQGKIIQTIAPEEMHGEYAWFFTHPYLFQGQNLNEVLLTIDILKLAQLSPIELNQIEYEYYVESIGDVSYVIG